ncbi:MAG TPA: signal peptidase I [Granulicella sp.]
MTPRPRLRYDHPMQHGGVLHGVQSLLYLIVIAIFIVGFSVQPYRIPSGSMEPTLMIGDFLLVDKQIVPTGGSHDPLPLTTVRHGDIVVFHYPVQPEVLLVKRVIGLPGDRIRLRDGRVYRNGLPQEEPYAVHTGGTQDSFRDNFPRLQSAEPGIESRWWIEMRHRIDNGDLVVPPGEFFVLGDNRNNSEDSRYWGFVPPSAIVGKPFLVYLSLAGPERDDPPAQAQLRSPVYASRYREGLLQRIVGLAHWDRTLRVIR